MSIQFSPLSTLKWVAIYGLCGAIPGTVLYLTPPEKLSDMIELNGESLTVRSVVSWFPWMMIGAAVATLVFAILFGMFHTLAAMMQGQFLHSLEHSPGPLTRLFAHGTERLFTTFRLLSAFLGVGLVLFGGVLIWRNILTGTLAVEIDRILLITALGIGLSTGAAFYKN